MGHALSMLRISETKVQGSSGYACLSFEIKVASRANKGPTKPCFLRLCISTFNTGTIFQSRVLTFVAGFYRAYSQTLEPSISCRQCQSPDFESSPPSCPGLEYLDIPATGDMRLVLCFPCLLRNEKEKKEKKKKMRIFLIISALLLSSLPLCYFNLISLCLS
ncbi:uncharacterized protein F4817DRAFT_60372 [Daldinia loculata]|uniref:uncharacterized protein n=1 Tax=Daldinia loculata TaxID=103429 RepID=UPI0020C3C9A2|nr:uncharacterized protein F4817DRAFT_60372 [Daldinia loculata]KAI1648621.1 hypothetical protein F4817DRAFT_60372 [Daldinia loculata]